MRTYFMKSGKFQLLVISLIIAFFALLLGIAVSVTAKNTSDIKHCYEESVKSGLISASLAARELIDPNQFESYNSVEDTDKDVAGYAQTLANLRDLRAKIGVTYIYALKKMENKYYFVFDTDDEEDTRFTEYDLAPVHESAFQGIDSAGILNVVDEFGSFNTGAVPIMKNGKVIGVVSADIEDTFVKMSHSAVRANTLYLVAAMSASMLVVLAISMFLMRGIQKAQDRLHYMANYDKITGLPNRHYLMNYLDGLSQNPAKTQTPFALLFIDIDNFKKVNDGAGHDAGDELLRQIANYLLQTHENSLLFRPPSGALNVSARLGGDEFIKIVHGIGTEGEAANFAKKVLDEFHSPAIDRFIEKFDVGMSIGMALYPLHSDNYHVLVKYADMAMYHAKREGKHIYRIFSFDMEPKFEK
ncbi:MAG: GGDEF domain-containing protein [Holophagaceae bacterium]|nr:GGDEF domain-containing protein [Holophagaceae bacterium]